MSKRILILVTIFCGMLFARETSTLSGFILDASSNESIAGANIVLSGYNIGGSSNTSGYYVIPDLPAGEYAVKCQYLGYKPTVENIRLKPGEKKRFNFFMNEEPLLGETIEISSEPFSISDKLYQKPISKIEIIPLQINKIPQIAETDLLRSLQTLPGIISISDFSSALYVRGGTPDQNLYMIDGAEIYNPEHTFGLFSTFNTDAIKQADMYKGGFGAEYGGRLSSVLDVAYKDGNRREWGGNASLSLLSGKTTLEVPLGDMGSLSGSVRRTYFDQTAAKFIKGIPNYYFYDSNIKANIDLNADSKLSISLFDSRDVLNFVVNEKSDLKTGFDYDWGNRTFSLRWTQIMTPKVFTKFWITRSLFSSDFNFSSGFDLVEKNELDDVTFKGTTDFVYSKSINAKFGFEQKIIHSNYKLAFSNSIVDVRQHSNHYVGFGAITWIPAGNWEIAGGLRYNCFKSDKNFAHLNPRLAVKHRFNDNSNFKFAAGMYSQFLHRISRGFISSLWTVSDRYQKGSRSLHAIFGYEKEILNGYSLEAEAYYKELNNIYSFNYNFMTDVKAKGFDEQGRTLYTDTQGQFNRGEGHSRGLEILLKKDTGILTGWLSYTHSQTLYKFDNINNNQFFTPRHDRTNTLNLIASLDVKRLISFLNQRVRLAEDSRWIFGLNAVYSSGQPITTPNSAYVTNLLPEYNEDSSGGYRRVTFAVYPTDINKHRLPYYARLDISVTYQKQYKNLLIAPYLQIFNVLNRKNIWFLQYTDESTHERINQTVNETYMLPFLPTIGIQVKF